MTSSLSVVEVVRGLQGSQDQAILQTEVRVLRSRSSQGARRLPGWKRTRRPSARRGSHRRPPASWRSGPVAGSRVRTRRWRSHLWPCPLGSGGGARSPRRVARSPARLRRAAMGRPLRLAASRPVCRPQTSPRGGGDGQARRETSPYRASRVAPIAWETDGVEPRGVHVCCQNDRSGPPGQVQPTRRGSSAVGGSGGPEESVFDVPVGPGSTHRWLGDHWDAWFSSSSAGTRTITE